MPKAWSIEQTQEKAEEDISLVEEMLEEIIKGMAKVPKIQRVIICALGEEDLANRRMVMSAVEVEVDADVDVEEDEDGGIGM